MQKLHSTRAIFTLYILVYSLTVIAVFLLFFKLQLTELNVSSVAAVAAVFDLFLWELGVILILGYFLLRASVLLRGLLYLLTSFYIIVYASQLAAFYKGGEFISRLAVENSNHVGLLLNRKTILGIISTIVICFALPLLIETCGSWCQKIAKSSKLSIVTIISVFIMSTASYWLPGSVLEQRNELLQDNYISHTAPVTAFIQVMLPHNEENTHDFERFSFSEVELKEIKKAGFYFEPQSRYPLVKEDIYLTSPPFEQLVGRTHSPNIIIFFTEGFSARTMQTYGSHIKNLTPNLDNFAKQAMVVDNYYNHTQATYRGIHGQLCSLFPTFGGSGGWDRNDKNLPQSDYYCLTDVFNTNKYDTIFLDAHRKKYSQLDEMVEYLGFKEVVTGEMLAEKYFKGSKPQDRYAFSDGHFMHGLIGFLKDRKSDYNDERPFFLGLYNLGTHAFREADRGGNTFSDGKNNALNTIYNFDHAFGTFWTYFKTSPYFENTIIVFTTDHCHYPEKPFIEAFAGYGYQGFMVDRIPLLIFDRTRRLPERYDALQATSIDFAPTLIHYLDLGSHSNPFMGQSIFERKKDGQNNIGFGSYGDNLFLVDSDKIVKYGFSDEYTIKMRIVKKYIDVTRKLELENRLWNKNLTD